MLSDLTKVTKPEIEMIWLNYLINSSLFNYLPSPYTFKLRDSWPCSCFTYHLEMFHYFEDDYSISSETIVYFLKTIKKEESDLNSPKKKSLPFGFRFD